MNTIYTLLGLLCSIQAALSNFEMKLFHDLTSNYVRFVRPVRSHNDNITVNFGVGLFSINRFNALTGEAEFVFWLRHMWKDENLVWSPEQYDGIPRLDMPINLIWKPDITLYNNLNAKMEYGYDQMAIVYSDGTVLWMPATIVRTKCSKHNEKFVCKFKFGSWTNDGNRLDVQFYESLEKFDLTSYEGHQDWKLARNRATREVKYYDCCPEPYPSLWFSLSLVSKD